MIKLARLGLFGWVVFFPVVSSRAQPAGNPALAIRQLGGGQIQLNSPVNATGVVLEQAHALARTTVWESIPTPPSTQGKEFSITVTGSTDDRFFRLRPELTRVRASSPVNGETGVAVTRETIVHFSAPLATSAALGANSFYAGFGGRRLLARVELSSDRLKASLFYLEPMPGSAQVNVVFDGTGLNDVHGNPLDADGDGQPGGTAVIGFKTLNLTALAGTAVIGHVFASELVPGADTGTNALNKPLGGVTITVDGMEETLRTVTDAQGNFKLDPAPPGRFFVHIDGRTVTNAIAGIHYPDKSYYPYVGKAWEATAGRTNNLAGGTGAIFLPLITVGTLQPVSMTTATVISFPAAVIARNPALAGVTITVPANSLFSDNGTRGGKVGIAPVPPDRLPAPLPPGLELPIVITVQTDGALNFDQPAPICFPNLPDPVLKTPLPASSKQALISFNHKKGIWEEVGSMTVSADGKFICTDPGVGILQPGWHGVGVPPWFPPPPPGAGPDPCPPSMGVSNADCVNRCQIEHGRALDSAIMAFQRDMEECGERCGKNGPNGELPCSGGDIAACQRSAARLLEEYRDLYDKKYHDCLKKCDSCFPRPASQVFGRRSRRDLLALAGLDSTKENDPVAGQLRSILEEIATLMRPFILSFPPIPPDIQNQIENLLKKADAVAGGDSGAYLTSQAVSAEEESFAFARSIGIEPEDLNRGNAPPYSVLYAAVVARPNGRFILRGETGPFGQYSLFVPRDGTVLVVSFYDPRTKGFGIITPNLSPNARFRLPRINLFPLPDAAFDFDQDGLPDLVEAVIGTNPTNPDSDGDGIPDGAEVDQGTNPLDGQPVRTGIVGTVKTPGSAVDVSASNDLLAVAEGTSGVSVFNIFDGLNPILVAHVDTPGTAQAVAMSGSLVAVADGEQGLAVIDVSDPAQAQIVQQVHLDGNAQTVAVAGKVAYVVLSTRSAEKPGGLIAVDLVTGAILEQLSFGAEVGDDVAVSGDEVYVLTRLALQIYGRANGRLGLLGRVPVEGQVAPLETGRKLFVGDGLAYVGHFTGYSIIDVRNPAAPGLIGTPPTTQLAVHDLVTTGSGLLLATTSFAGPQTLAVSLYDAAQPTNVTRFLTTFDTPGDARALTIHNGLAYVADSSAGIQVLNYLSFDGNHLPPTITLGTSASNRTVEAGTTLRVTATARDDVQVRNVEFYVDEVKAFSDGNFPFEFRFDVPALTPVKPNVTLRARGVDTGGNFTWSEELVLTLVPDNTPPRILAAAPLGGGKVVSSLSAYFSEPMNPATLNSASFRLIAAGADGLPGTADDLPVGGGVVTYRPEQNEASLNFGAPLPDGIYRAVVTTAAADQTGNRLAADYAWQFRVSQAVFWSQSLGGRWEDGFNWSTGTPPGPNDDVILELIPGEVTITLEASASVKSLLVGEPVAILGGTLQVTEPIELHQPLTLNGGTLKGGTVKQNAEAKLIFTADARNTLDGVNVVGDLELTNNSARALIRNGLSLDGSVVLDNVSAITFAGDQTFNTGQVVFGKNGLLLIAPGTTLTLGPAMVVRGKSGVIGGGDFGSKKLINQGLISADVAGGTFTIRPTEFENEGVLEGKNGGSVFFLDGPQRNTGRIDLSGGGVLTLNGAWSNGGTITANEATVNLDGTFRLADLGRFNRTGGTVNLTGVLDLSNDTLTLDAKTGPWSMSGGTLKDGTVKQTAGAKLLFLPPSAMATFDNMRVAGDLELTNSGAQALIRNGLILTGNVLLDHTGAITFAGNQTFNTGPVVFGESGLLLLAPGTTLTLGPAMVVRGKSGVIGGGDFGKRKLINQGLISADVPGGTLSIVPAQFENPGTLRADGAGTSVVIRVTPFTNTGTIQELNGGKVVIAP